MQPIYGRVVRDTGWLAAALCCSGSRPNDQGQADLPRRISHLFYTTYYFFFHLRLLFNLLTIFLHIRARPPRLLRNTPPPHHPHHTHTHTLSQQSLHIIIYGKKKIPYSGYVSYRPYSIFEARRFAIQFHFRPTSNTSTKDNWCTCFLTQSFCSFLWILFPWHCWKIFDLTEYWS